MKALLLAAGFGSRLKPLTDHVPKPLTLFMGQPILDIVYRQVIAAGIQAVAVNTHHLSEKIALHIQKSSLYKQPIQISHEDEILGTGGSINPLRPWLGVDDLLIFNGDIVTSLDLSAFVKAHAREKPIASMVLLDHKEGTTPVYVKDGRVVSIGEPFEGALKRTFAGIHILSRGFVKALPQSGFLSVIDTYKELLGREKVLAFDHAGYWADLGIPKDYLEAHKELWQHPDRESILKALQLDSSSWNWSAKDETLFIGGAVQEGFKKSFVFGTVKADQPIHIQRCIVYAGIELTKHSHEENKIITPYARLNII
jgi:mannose-1-phosphate guanylyltransferase